MHQVLNEDYGINIAWNLAPFTFESIKGLMRGFNDEVQVGKNPIVPVQRVLHQLITRLHSSFSSSEIHSIVPFLKESVSREQKLHQTILSKNPEMREISRPIDKWDLPVNNCFKCKRAFYSYYYLIPDEQSWEYLCGDCSNKKKKSAIKAFITIPLY